MNLKKIYESGKYLDVVSYVDSLKDPNLEDLRYKMLSLSKLGLFEETIETAKQIILFDRDNVEAILTMANSYLYLNKLNKAKELYLKILKIDKNNITAMNNIGLVERMCKNYDEAIKWFEKASKINSSDRWTALANKASLLLDLGKTKEALKDLKKAYEISKDPKVLMLIGNCYLEDDNYDKAEEYYLKAISKGYCDQYTLYNLGLCYYYMKRYDKAKEYLEDAKLLSRDTSLIKDIEKILSEIENKK